MRAAGSGRRKVALPPGRSQLDWIRTAAALPQRGRPRVVPRAELRQHRSRDDAWMAINGQVYDVFPYLEFHPGGIPILLSGAGKVTSFAHRPLRQSAPRVSTASPLFVPLSPFVCSDCAFPRLVPRVRECARALVGDRSTASSAGGVRRTRQSCSTSTTLGST